MTLEVFYEGHSPTIDETLERAVGLKCSGAGFDGHNRDMAWYGLHPKVAQSLNIKLRSIFPQIQTRIRNDPEELA